MQRSSRMLILMMLSSPGMTGTAAAATLPGPEQVACIRVEPHDHKIKDFYTPRSLLAALPHLRETSLGRTMAFGKVWLWQRGIMVLRDGREIPWRTFTNNVIVIDGETGPVFYTDVLSQTSVYAAGRIMRTVYTWNGLRHMELD